MIDPMVSEVDTFFGQAMETAAERMLSSGEEQEALIAKSVSSQRIVWLASDESSKTTGHVIPVDGGLPEAFLR